MSQNTLPFNLNLIVIMGISTLSYIKLHQIELDQTEKGKVKFEINTPKPLFNMYTKLYY